MTLKEQLKAVNLADEASQHSLIESCSNLHFLTHAYLATSPSVNVRRRILFREDLHVVVLKVLESTMPANLKELVRNHKSYKVKKADELNLREFVLSCRDSRHNPSTGGDLLHSGSRSFRDWRRNQARP